MIKSWFLAITDFSVYRCLTCRKFVNTPITMAPLFKHLATYHAGVLAEALAKEGAARRAGEMAKARAAAA